MAFNIMQKNDTTESTLGNIYTGLYFYLMDNELKGYNGEENTQIIGNCPTIENLLYVPFLNRNLVNIDVIASPYDKNRFGAIDGKHPQMSGNPYVFRYAPNNSYGIEVKLGNIPKITTQGSFTTRHYNNESKLQYFPYRYMMICDFMNTPLTIKPQYLAHKTNEVKAKITFSNKSTYSIFVQDYKGDKGGNMEGIISSCSLDLPVSSSTYSSFMATNKAQFMTGNQFNIMDMGIGIASNLMNLKIGGALESGYNSYKNIATTMAKKKDMLSTPNAIKTMGGDVMFSLHNSDRKICLIEYTLTEEYKNRIGDFFAMYGYKQNKMMTPNVESRYYYNFLKCSQANIQGTIIPKEHLQEIKEILENGVTFWHIDRKDVNMFDYSMDNKEVY